VPRELAVYEQRHGHDALVLELVEIGDVF